MNPRPKTWKKLHEEFGAQELHRYVGRDDPLVLEIGCNEADDTTKFLAEMPDGIFHCFEPDPRAIAKFKTKQLPPNVHLYELAISDQEGEAEFHQSDGHPDGDYWKSYGPHWDKSGSLLPDDQHTKLARWMSFLPPIRVKTMTLDRWAAEHLSPEAVADFIWMDCQGAEAMVLRGGQAALRRTRFVYAECDPRPLYQGMATLEDLDDLLVGFSRLPFEWRGFNFLWRNDSL